MRAKLSSSSKLAMALAAIFLPGLAAHAQIEEIVVTAQKRVESLGDVPIAVTAFTGDSLKEMGVTDASQLINLTPGLNSGQPAGSNRNYYLRGIGTGDFHLTAASAVGQYYDGVTLTSGFLARSALFDMERVEVLKGPQNTLFGLNTTGGAINYISKKPEVGAGMNGNASLRLGSDSLVNIDAAIGFDLGENAAGRIAVHTNKFDGPFESVSTPGLDLGDDDMTGYRAAFVWEPSDRSRLLVNFHGLINKNNNSANQGLGTRNPDGLGTLCADFNTGIQNFEDNTNCLGRNGVPGPIGAGNLIDPPTDPSTGDWNTVTATHGFEDISANGFFINFDYDYDWATLSFSAAFDTLDIRSSFDSDGTATLGLHTNQGDDRDIAQYEVRLISQSDAAFRWIAGAFYLDEDADSFTGVISPGIPPVPGIGSVTIPNVQVAHTKENLGIYVQGEYDFTDSITLTAGVRASDEDITASYLPSRPLLGNIPNTQPLFASDIDAMVRAQANPANPNQDANGYDVRRQVQQTLPNEDVGYTVKLDWKATDDSMAYLSFSKGFKGSAVDVRAAFANVPIPNILQGLEDARIEPESLDAWELGYKGSFLDNRIQFDAALFHYTYFNKQVFVTGGAIPTLRNAPESESSGIDGSLKYANDTGFYLDFGFSFLDTEITEVGSSPFLEGADLDNAPGYSFTLLAAKEFDLANGNMLRLMANVYSTDDYVTQVLQANNPISEDSLSQKAYTLLNANATYRFGRDQQFGLSVFGDNLTEERFCGAITIPGTATYGNVVPGGALNMASNCRVTRASTRTYGVSFAMDF